MQSVEYQSHPYSSHVEVPYDWEQLGAYTMSHHSVILDDQYDDISYPVMDRGSLHEHIPIWEEFL